MRLWWSRECMALTSLMKSSKPSSCSNRSVFRHFTATLSYSTGRNAIYYIILHMDSSPLLQSLIFLFSYNSSSRGLPFSTFHHSERAISQFLVEREVSVTDDAGEIGWLSVWLNWGWGWAAEHPWGLGIRVRPLPSEHLLAQAQRLRLRVIPPASALKMQ